MALISTCRTIHHEATPVLYQKIHLSIHVAPPIRWQYQEEDIAFMLYIRNQLVSWLDKVGHLEVAIFPRGFRVPDILKFFKAIAAVLNKSGSSKIGSISCCVCTSMAERPTNATLDGWQGKCDQAMTKIEAENSHNKEEVWLWQQLARTIEAWKVYSGDKHLRVGALLREFVVCHESSY